MKVDGAWRARQVLVLVSLVALVASSAARGQEASAADPFYLTRLAEGERYFAVQNYSEAAKSLEIACFGLLQAPPLLGRCLGTLTLALARAQRPAEAREVYSELVVAEQTVGAWSKSRLDPPVDAALRRFVLDQVPRELWSDQPAIAAWAEPAAEVPSTAAPVNAQEPEATPEQEPRGDLDASVPPPADVPLPSDPELPTELPGAEPGPESLNADLTALEGELATARSTTAYRLLFDRAEALAEQAPDEPRSQLLAAQLAYRLRLWEEAARHFDQVDQVPLDEPLLLFYQAVSLWEVGRGEEAASALELCLPRLRRTPFVESYVERILGGP